MAQLDALRTQVEASGESWPSLGGQIAAWERVHHRQWEIAMASNQLRGSGSVRAAGDQAARVLAVCLLSPTGRELYGRFVRPGTETGWVAFGTDAMTVLTAFANAKEEL